MSIDLFAPYRLGDLELANRFVMAPLTRSRAAEGGVPGDLAVTYYAQRATAGLIVAEGTQPSATGQGYPGTPGLHTDEQVAGWRRVADAVHAEGGSIVVQLMHCGRISHPTLTGTDPVAPSAVRAAGQIFTGAGLQDFVTPRALALDELPAIKAEYVDAARRAVAAGLDGVELHAANGYLLHQFLSDNTNTRTDAYGGSPQNRTRFVVEVAAAVAEAIGPRRVGVRISPAGTFNDIHETETEATYTALVDGLNPLGLLYLHLLEESDAHTNSLLRKQFAGVMIHNNGTGNDSTLAAAQRLVDEGIADLVSFGRPFLANPDLVERMRTGASWNEPDLATFYAGGAQGYTSYPALTR